MGFLNLVVGFVLGIIFAYKTKELKEKIGNFVSYMKKAWNDSKNGTK